MSRREEEEEEVNAVPMGSMHHDQEEEEELLLTLNAKSHEAERRKMKKDAPETIFTRSSDTTTLHITVVLKNGLLIKGQSIVTQSTSYWLNVFCFSNQSKAYQEAYWSKVVGPFTVTQPAFHWLDVRQIKHSKNPIGQRSLNLFSKSDDNKKSIGQTKMQHKIY